MILISWGSNASREWKTDQKLFPQQEPGPAHPEAWPGDDPQHAVSLKPGILSFDGPDMEEWAAMSFFRFLLPQWLQVGSSDAWTMSSSLSFPQSLH